MLIWSFNRSHWETEGIPVRGRAKAGSPLADGSLQADQSLSLAVKGCLKGTANWNNFLYLDASHTSSIWSTFAKRYFWETLIIWQQIRFQEQLKSVFIHAMLFFCDFTSKMLLKNLPHCFAREKKKRGKKKFCLFPRFIVCSAWTSVNLTNLGCFCISRL